MSCNPGLLDHGGHQCSCTGYWASRDAFPHRRARFPSCIAIPAHPKLRHDSSSEYSEADFRKCTPGEVGLQLTRCDGRHSRARRRGWPSCCGSSTQRRTRGSLCAAAWGPSPSPRVLRPAGISTDRSSDRPPRSDMPASLLKSCRALAWWHGLVVCRVRRHAHLVPSFLPIGGQNIMEAVIEGPRPVAACKCARAASRGHTLWPYVLLQSNATKSARRR